MALIGAIEKAEKVSILGDDLAADGGIVGRHSNCVEGLARLVAQLCQLLAGADQRL